MTVTIDNKASRVVIPKRGRDHMGFEPGAALALQSEGEPVDFASYPQEIPDAPRDP